MVTLRSDRRVVSSIEILKERNENRLPATFVRHSRHCTAYLVWWLRKLNYTAYFISEEGKDKFRGLQNFSPLLRSSQCHPSFLLSGMLSPSRVRPLITYLLCLSLDRHSLDLCLTAQWPHVCSPQHGVPMWTHWEYRKYCFRWHAAWYNSGSCGELLRSGPLAKIGRSEVAKLPPL